MGNSNIQELVWYRMVEFLQKCQNNEKANAVTSVKSKSYMVQTPVCKNDLSK